MTAMCMEAAAEPNYVGRAFRRDATVAKKTLRPDLFLILREMMPELWSQKNWNDRDACYTFPTNSPNRGRIYLAGTNDPATLKGQTQIDSFFNESTEHSLEAKRQMESRTERYKTYDWNPSESDHWIFTDVLAQDPSKYFYIHSTFRDNPYLTDEIVASIEKWEPTTENIKAGTASDWHWQVYGLGLRAQRPGAIYTDWRTTEQWPERMACSRWGYALDFGFSIDPTALVECAFFQDHLYLREIVYETGLINLKRQTAPGIPSLEGRLQENNIDKASPIWADSAHSDLIAELNIAGYNVQGFNKKRGTEGKYVLTGIKRLQQQSVRVHHSSNNIIREKNNYIWKHDKNNVQLNEPIGDFNHALDAIRGWAMEELEPRRVGPRGRARVVHSKIDPYAGLYPNRKPQGKDVFIPY